MIAPILYPFSFSNKLQESNITTFKKKTFFIRDNPDFYIGLIGNRHSLPVSVFNKVFKYKSQISFI